MRFPLGFGGGVDTGRCWANGGDIRGMQNLRIGNDHMHAKDGRTAPRVMADESVK